MAIVEAESQAERAAQAGNGSDDDLPTNSLLDDDILPDEMNGDFEEAFDDDGDLYDDLNGDDTDDE